MNPAPLREPPKEGSMKPKYLAPPSGLSTGALRALIQIRFEEFLALVDPALAAALVAGRAVCRDPQLEAPAGVRRDAREDAAPLFFTVPARRGPARTLVVAVARGGERRESRQSVEDRLLDAYLDAFVHERRPDRLIAVFPEGPEGAGGEPPAVHLRTLVDRLDGDAHDSGNPRDPGERLLRLPYLAVTLGGQPLDAYLTRRCFADNLAPFHTPFRKEPPCSSVSSVCPSRERRRFSIP
jgi:hypothetical protein